jgi:TnsA endonuclease N terminal
MSYKGRFTPKHPEKYQGNPEGIVWRSLWERAVMVKLDEWPQVIAWMSEEISIKYVSPVDNKVHRYFPDFLVAFKDKDGAVRKVILEVKPKKYCFPPKTPKRKTKRYYGDCIEYAKNQAKWTAARAFAAEQSMGFQILTEDDIFKKASKK